MSTQVTIDLSTAQLASLRIEYKRSLQPSYTEEGFQNFVKQKLIMVVENTRDRYAADRITVGEFIGRNPAAYARIMANKDTDPVIQQLAQKLEISKYVWLGSSEVQQAITYLIQKTGIDGQPVLSLEQAAQLLQYNVPSFD